MINGPTLQLSMLNILLRVVQDFLFLNVQIHVYELDDGRDPERTCTHEYVH